MNGNDINVLMFIAKIILFCTDDTVINRHGWIERENRRGERGQTNPKCAFSWNKNNTLTEH